MVGITCHTFAPLRRSSLRELGAGPALVIMGISHGDQWTNMIQPFWTIPLLAIAGLTVRALMGCTIITLFVGAVMLVTLLLVSFAWQTAMDHQAPADSLNPR